MATPAQQARASAQLEHAAALKAAAVKALASLTINTTRSLGDARRDPSPRFAEEHRAAVDKAASDIDLSDVMAGRYDARYVYEKLKLELSPSDLIVSSEPPKYEKLRVVLAALDQLLEDRGIFGAYRDLVEKKRDELLKVEETFRNSQVDIDDMAHEGFHEVVDILKRVVLTSVESVVEQLNAETELLLEDYAKAIRVQQDRFEEERDVVATASPARMRPARPEDDEDPWQMPAEALEIRYESDVLQAYVDQEKQARVAEVYEHEWTQERRRDISRLLPRALKLSAEQDVDLTSSACDTLTRLAELSGEKVRRVRETIANSDAVTTSISEDLQKAIAAIKEAGAAFQARRHAQRSASERDIAKLQAFMAAESKHDASTRTSFESILTQQKKWLADNDAEITDRIAKIAALQEEVVALAANRQAVSDDIMASVEAEQQRRSDLRETIRNCEIYEEMLHVSMRNFLLPEGYSSVLQEFAENSEALAKERFDSQAATLDRLLRAAAVEAHATRSTAFVAPRLLVFRYKKRIDDVLAKAALARAMREFCDTTKDPYLSQHETTEAELLAIANRIEAQVPALQEASEAHRQKYDALDAVFDQCGVARAVRDLDELFLRVLDEREEFVVRASRPPLVTLPPLAETSANGEPVSPDIPHLLTPDQHYPMYIVERAAKAHNVVRQFV